MNMCEDSVAGGRRVLVIGDGQAGVCDFRRNGLGLTAPTTGQCRSTAPWRGFLAGSVCRRRACQAEPA